MVDKGAHIFLRGIPKIKVTACLEIELICYDVTVQNISNYAVNFPQRVESSNPLYPLYLYFLDEYFNITIFDIYVLNDFFRVSYIWPCDKLKEAYKMTTASLIRPSAISNS